MNPEILGERLREVRNYLGLKQEEVARYLKIPKTALLAIENGQRHIEAIELTQLALLYRQQVAHLTNEADLSYSLQLDVAHFSQQVEDLSPQDQSELVRFSEYLHSRSAPLNK